MTYVAPTGGSGGATNLTITTSSTAATINSDTGTDATIPVSTSTVGGLMSGADRSKLDGIASGAQVNPTNYLTTDSTQTIANTAAKTFQAGALLMTSTAGTGEPYSDANPPLTLNMSNQASSPTTPPTGQSTLYTTDGKILKLKDDDATEVEFAPKTYVDSAVIAGGDRTFQFHYTDFFATTGLGAWSATAISTGTTASVDGNANHPGIVSMTSSTTANSGYRYGLFSGGLLLAGGEICEVIFQVTTAATTTVRLGFHDSSSSADAVDGAYIEIVGTTLSGKTASNSTRSTTGTTLTITTATWYRAKIELNSNATSVTYTVMNEAGTVLWTNSLTTNIPTGAGRTTGQGIIATSSGTTAVALGQVDYMSLRMTRTLVR